MRRAPDLLAVLLAGSLGASLSACVPASDREALGIEWDKEWQRVPSFAEWHGGPSRNEKGLVVSCASPASTERSLTQNGVNDEVSYRQCPPLAPAGPKAPLPQPWPPTQSGQRLDPRS